MNSTEVINYLYTITWAKLLLHSNVKGKKMKKVFLLFLFVIFSFPCFSQTLNESYFPKNNEIDKQFKIENKNWSSNYEWQLLLGKYNSIWKNQMYLEMERLISILPESEKEIRENQKKWEEAIEQSLKLVNENIDFNKVGKVVYIGEYLNGIMNLYRERAKYYLCLYYTIKEQKSKDILYTDINKTELAK